MTRKCIVFLFRGIGRWVPAGRCKEPNLTVSNLIPGQEYTFRVSAVNSEGESEPLVADHSIIAKNPFGKIIKKNNLISRCHQL